MTTAPYQQQHLKSLTGLRFLAALSVFVAHVSVHWPQLDFGDLPFVDFLIVNFPFVDLGIGDLPFGAAGVSFFYVLSGFILTYVYGSQMSRDSGQASDATDGAGRNKFSFRRFYLKRFARIWPLHFATLLISMFLVMGVQSFFNRPFPYEKLVLNGLLLQSWVPNYQWIYSLNGPSWSLSVEAFFYFVFPFLLLGGARKFIGMYVLIAVGTIVALITLGHYVPQEGDAWIKLNAIIHANPLMRLLEFATGVGCGFLHVNRRRRVLDSDSSNKIDWLYELLAIGAVAVFFSIANMLEMYGTENQTGLPIGVWYWFRFCGAAPAFAVLVFVFANTNGLFSKFLGSRLMVYLGEISYSFYMIHMSVMLVLVRQDWLDGPGVVWGTALCSLAISLFLSSALYQLVELPFRRAIVDAFDRKGIKSVSLTLVNSVGTWIRSPWFVPMLALAIGSGWFINQNRFDIHDSRRIAAIVSESDPDLQNVKFERDATLLGVRTRQLESGEIEVEMAWQLSQGRRSERFIKLLDSQRKVIGRGDPNRRLFDRVQGDDTVIDRVRLAPGKMDGVEVIAVGFFDPVRKAAVVDRGPRGARDRQLHVWEK